MIPPEHDAAAVFAARYVATSGEGTRAFSGAARAKRWVEKQTAQDLEWTQDADTWTASTKRMTARIERITLHDPVTLRRRFEDAFNGDYG